MPRITFYRSLLFLIEIYSNLLDHFNKKEIVFHFFLILFHYLFAKKQMATQKSVRGGRASVDFHLEYYID